MNHLKYYLISLGMFLIFGIIQIIKIWNKHEKANAYYSSLNLEFGGIVMDKRLITSRYALVEVVLKNSSVKEYDPRGIEDVYFCVIKDSLAEIIAHPYQIEKGDSLVYSGVANQIQIFREHSLVAQLHPHSADISGLYQKARKMHKL
ncbi:MAG: hypothetical protein R3D00_00110 [Bacteroidia bacterium]